MMNTDQKIIQPKLIIMKTSNKFLILITIVIISFMVIYDNDLKAEYVKGDFKSRFHNMEQLSIKDFHNIDILSADVIDVTIEKGPKFAVWVNKNFKDDIKLYKQGKTLMIKYTGPAEQYNYYSGAIIITCPQLDSLTTTANTAQKVEKFQSNTYVGDIDVIGFDQQKMVLKANRLTQIELKNNKIENMQAVIGNNSNDIGSLNINSSNQIKLANIKVNGISELKMSNPKITTIEHSFSDSASLILSGSALRLLNK